MAVFYKYTAFAGYLSNQTVLGSALPKSEKNKGKIAKYAAGLNVYR
jgi:hypothetical protein